MIKRISQLISENREILRYLIVGGLTTLVSLGTYYLLVWRWLDPTDGIQLQVANVISWIAAVTFAYLTNRFFVFKSKNPNMLKEASAFYLSRVGTLLIENGLMFLGVTVFHWNDKIMKIIVQAVVMVGNYVLSKLFIFRKSRKEPEAIEDAEGAEVTGTDE